MRNKAALIRGKRGIARPGQYCNGPLQYWPLDIRSPFEMSRASAIGHETHSNEVRGGDKS